MRENAAESLPGGATAAASWGGEGTLGLKGSTADCSSIVAYKNALPCFGTDLIKNRFGDFPL